MPPFFRLENKLFGYLLLCNKLSPDFADCWVRKEEGMQHRWDADAEWMSGVGGTERSRVSQHLVAGFFWRQLHSHIWLSTGLQVETLARTTTCGFSSWLRLSHSRAASGFLHVGSGLQRWVSKRTKCQLPCLCWPSFERCGVISI